MTNPFNTPQAATPRHDNNATQNVRHTDRLDPNPTPTDAPRHRQDSESGADGAVLPDRVQASPATQTYRRSLFRR
jgi:hypothetical protein